MTSSPQAARQRPLLGIALKLGAVVAMGLMYAMVKLSVESGVHSLEALFFRNAFAIPVVGAYILATGQLRRLATRRPLAHVARGTVGVISMICGFTAVGLMPLGEFTAINFASPLFITLLSVPVLGERVGVHRWAAVLVGFIGVLVMVRPDPVHLMGVGPLLALGSAFFAAGAMLAVRQLGATEPGPTIAFYFLVFGAGVGALSLPFVWTDPGPRVLILLMLAGLFGGVGQLLQTQAFRVAPAAVVAPFEYAALLWAALIGYALWREVPAPSSVGGGLIVVASGLYIFWRELRGRRNAG